MRSKLSALSALWLLLATSALAGGLAFPARIAGHELGRYVALLAETGSGRNAAVVLVTEQYREYVRQELRTHLPGPLWASVRKPVRDSVRDSLFEPVLKPVLEPVWAQLREHLEQRGRDRRPEGRWKDSPMERAACPACSPMPAGDAAPQTHLLRAAFRAGARFERGSEGRHRRPLLYSPHGLPLDAVAIWIHHWRQQTEPQGRSA